MKTGSSEEGLSFRQLMLAFLAVVALCAVFFSLGFFVGYKERTSSAAPITESVPPPSDVPPVVNSPSEGAPPGDSGTAGPSAQRGSPTSAPNSAATSGQAPATSAGVEESNLPNPTATAPAPTSAPARSEPQAVANPPRESAPPEVVKGITVQVAALSSRADADSLINVLKARGYKPFVMSPQQAGADDSFFRVVVGPFSSSAEAVEARDKLQLDGFKPFIRK